MVSLTVLIRPLEVCRRDVPDRLKKALVVEPVHPVEGGEFNGFYAAPRAVAVNDLGLVKPDDRLGEGVVVATADAS